MKKIVDLDKEKMADKLISELNALTTIEMHDLLIASDTSENRKKKRLRF